MSIIPPPPATEEPALGPFTPGVPPPMMTHIERPAPIYQMTPAAGPATRAQFHENGWTDEQLVQAGYMVAS